MPTRMLLLPTIIFFSVFLLLAHESSAADFSCPTEKAYLAQKTDIPELEHQFDAACFIDLEALTRSQLLVDVRTPSSFGRFRSLGSINVPATKLIASDALKTQSIVLVGNGADRFAMGQLCGRMIEEGFRDPKILLGGVRTLAEIGRPTNRPPGVFELSTIGPRELITELMHDQINLVATSDRVIGEVPALKQQFAGTLNIERRSEMISALAQMAADPMYPVALVGPESEYKEILAAFRGTVPPNVYLVRGGAAAVQTFIRENGQIRTAMKSVPKRYKCS